MLYPISPFLTDRSEQGQTPGPLLGDLSELRSQHLTHAPELKVKPVRLEAEHKPLIGVLESRETEYRWIVLFIDKKAGRTNECRGSVGSSVEFYL